MSDQDPEKDINYRPETILTGSKQGIVEAGEKLEGQIDYLLKECQRENQTDKFFQVQGVKVEQKSDSIVINWNYPKERENPQLEKLKLENSQLKEQLQYQTQKAMRVIEELESEVKMLSQTIEQKEELIQKLQLMGGRPQFENGIQVIEVPTQVKEITSESIVREIPVYIEKQIVKQVPIFIPFDNSSHSEEQVKGFFNRIRRVESMPFQSQVPVKTYNELKNLVESQESFQIRGSLIDLLMKSQNENERNEMEDQCRFIRQSPIQIIHPDSQSDEEREYKGKNGKRTEKPPALDIELDGLQISDIPSENKGYLEFGAAEKSKKNSQQKVEGESKSSKQKKEEKKKYEKSGYIEEEDVYSKIVFVENEELKQKYIRLKDEVQRLRMEKEEIVKFYQEKENQQNYQILEVPIQHLIPEQVYVEKQKEIVREIPIEIETVKEVIIEREGETIIKEIIKKEEIIKEIPVEVEVQVVREMQVEVIRQVQVIREKQVQVIREIEKPVQVIVQVIKEVQKPVQVIREIQIIKEIEKPVEVIREIQVIKEIQIPKEVEVIREVQVIKQIQVQKPVQVQVIREIQVIKEIEVIKQIEKQVIKEIQKPIQIEVIKEIQVQVIKEVQKPIQVVKEIQVIKQIERQIIKEVEKPVEVEVIRQIQVIKEINVQVIKEIQKPVEVIKEVQVVKQIQIIKEVDKPIQIIREIQVIKQVERIVQVPTSVGSTLSQQIPVFIPSYVEITKIIQIPSTQSEIPLTSFENRKSSLPLSDHSSDDHRYHPKQDFYIHGSHQKIKQASIDFNLIEKYEQNEKRLSQQNAYLRDQIYNLGLSLETSATKNEEYRQQIVKLNSDYKELKHELQQKSFVRNRSAELQVKLKTQLESKSSLEQKIKGYEVQISKNSQVKTKYDKQIQHLKSSKNLTDIEVMKKDKEIEYLSKQIEEKQDQIYEGQREIKFLSEQIKVFREEEGKIMREKHQLQDEVIQMKNQIQDYHSNRIREEEQIRIQMQEAKNVQESVEEMEKLYKKQINDLIQKYTKIINENQMTIMELQEMVMKVQKQTGGRVRPASTLEEENQNLRKVIDSLSSELKRMKKNSGQVQDKSHLRFTFSPSQEQIKEPILIQENQQNTSSIRIEDIDENVQEDDDENVPNNNFGFQLDKKNRQIEKLKKLILTYEATIQEMQGEIFSDKQKQVELPSNRQEINTYVSNLQRKFQYVQDSLSRQRAEKHKMSMKMREIEKRMEDEAVSKTINQSYFTEDSQLLEQVVYELEKEKNINQHLRQQIFQLKRYKNDSFMKVRNQKSIVHSFDENLYEDISPEFLDNETLYTQVQIYKCEYYKALDANRNLKYELCQLEEELRNVNNMSSHLDMLSNLTKKVTDYETIIIPKLKQQIRKSRNQASSRNRYRSTDYDPLYIQNQQSPTFTRRDIQQSNQLLVKNSYRYENENFPRFSQEKRIQSFESPRILELSAEKDVQGGAKINLNILIKKQLSQYSKYVLAYKLIQFAEEISKKQVVESYCPEKIQLLNFDEEDLNLFKVAKSEEQNKVKDKLKFYQAPEVLVGQPQSQKSLTWTIGIIIDEIFMGKCFYRKFAQILAPKNNYEFKLSLQEYEEIGKILEKMILKDRQQRISLEEVKERLGLILDAYE